ncbi:hypothetical protein BHM03_00053302, partial [Ensete ventricosum]
ANPEERRCSSSSSSRGKMADALVTAIGKGRREQSQSPQRKRAPAVLTAWSILAACFLAVYLPFTDRTTFQRKTILKAAATFDRTECG